MRQLGFFRNRFYDQQTGLWTQEDPIGVAGGVNLYQFNGNNPVMFTAPFGLCFGPFVLACPAIIEGAMYAVGAVIGVAAINDISGKISNEDAGASGAEAMGKVGRAVRKLVTGILIGAAPIPSDKITVTDPTVTGAGGRPEATGEGNPPAPPRQGEDSTKKKKKDFQP